MGAKIRNEINKNRRLRPTMRRKTVGDSYEKFRSGARRFPAPFCRVAVLAVFMGRARRKMPLRTSRVLPLNAVPSIPNVPSHFLCVFSCLGVSFFFTFKAIFVVRNTPVCFIFASSLLFAFKKASRLLRQYRRAFTVFTFFTQTFPQQISETRETGAFDMRPA